MRPLDVAVSLLRADAPEEIVDDTREWKRWEKLLPHVLTVVEHAVPDADPDAVRGLAWLLNRAGSYLHVQGRLAQGVELLERGMRMTEDVYGRDHRYLAFHLNNLALALQDFGRAGEARPLAERALAIAEVSGLGRRSVAACLINLARIRGRLGELAEARSLAERAVRILESALGPDHPDTGKCLHNLAEIRLLMSEPEAALALVERARAIIETAFGSDHPNIASSLNLLGQIRFQLGDVDTARALTERGLRLAERWFEPDHPLVTTLRENLDGMS